MDEQPSPEIGQWYVHRDKGEMFRVTAYDAAAHTIEIQTFDGDVDELDEEAWSSLVLERAEEPEDWTGPLDEMELDDLGYSETAMTPADWAEPLQPFQPQQESWQELDPEDRPDADAEEG